MNLRRSIGAAVAAVALAVPLGAAAPAQAAAPTPAEIQQTVHTAVVASRAAADHGLRATRPSDFTGTDTIRYDGTNRRYWFTNPTVTTTHAEGVTYRFFPDRLDAKIRRFMGLHPRTWVRFRTGEDEVVPPAMALDELFQRYDPSGRTPTAGSATAGPAGSTVYSLDFADPVRTVTWTVDGSGRMVASTVHSPGSAPLRSRFAYAPQTVRLPKHVVGLQRWTRGGDAYLMPKLLRSDAENVAALVNGQRHRGVVTIRNRAVEWRRAWNAGHPGARGHVQFVRGGVRLWVVQPITGRTLARRVVLVHGRAVVR